MQRRGTDGGEAGGEALGVDLTMPYPFVEQIKTELDVTLLEANLRLTPGERVEKMRRLCEFASEFRRSVRASGARTGVV